MKLLFLDHAPIIGGAQLVLVNYLKELSKDNELLVVTSTNSRFLSLLKDIQNCSVVSVEFGKLKNFSPVSLKNFLRLFGSINQCIKHLQPDLVISNTERMLYPGLFSCILNRQKMVWLVRDFRYNRVLFFILSTFPKKIIFVSNALKTYYFSPKNSEVVHVSSNFYQKNIVINDPERLKFANEFKLHGKIVIGFLGRLVEWKGYKLLAKVVESLPENVVGLFVGVGEGGEVPASSKKCFFSGFQTQPEIALSLFDIFVLPSLEPEPYATSVVEALMFKKPVVASNNGGTPEIIKDKETGLLVLPGNFDALREAILSLVNSSELRTRLANNGYEEVLKENKSEEEVARLKKIFYSL